MTAVGQYAGAEHAADPAFVARITQLESIIAAGTPSAAAWSELAALKFSIRDLPGAIDAYQRCLPLASDTHAILNNLGVAQMHASRFSEAIASFEAALALAPGYARPLVNLGKVLREVGRLGEAIERLQQALGVSPDYPPALVNLGDALSATGEIAAAEMMLERALLLAPDLVEAKVSLADLRSRSERIPQAVEILREALSAVPDHAEAHLMLARLLFMSGDWSGAWPHFEYRFRSRSRPTSLRRPAGAQWWDGQSASGREICLLGEQGLGDQIQFARYAKLMSEHGMRTTLVCDRRLTRLLTDAKLADRVLPQEDLTQLSGASCMPLMSAPNWHGTRPDGVPAPNAYLAVDPQRRIHWRALLSRERPVVAIAWAGNPEAETGIFLGRSTSIDALTALLNVPGAEFACLQKQVGEPEWTRHPLAARLRRWAALDEGPYAFLDSAAILVNVDLLVTVDTSIAHVAGALGVRTWLCLKPNADWRWGMRDDSTPWYRSVRLIRRKPNEEWPEFFVRVADDLRAWLARDRLSADS